MGDLGGDGAGLLVGVRGAEGGEEEQGERAALGCVGGELVGWMVNVSVRLRPLLLGPDCRPRAMALEAVRLRLNNTTTLPTPDRPTHQSLSIR